MRLKQILAGAAVVVTLALGMISPATAAITSYTAVPGGYVFFGTDGAGSVNVSDYYGLTVSTASTLVATATPNTLPSDTGTLFSFSSFAVTLEEWTGSAWAVISSANLGTTGVTLASGLYQLVVTGTTSGLYGGVYSGNASLSPVPIPGAIVLFGSGLLGLVGFARRRISGRAAA